VGGSDNGNAHASIDKATNHGVWLLPFVRVAKRVAFPLEQLLCFSADQAIGGYNKRREVSTPCGIIEPLGEVEEKYFVESPKQLVRFA
jgi:hypothetical protein